MAAIKVGIIGGTGLDRDASLIQDKREVPAPPTPYGPFADPTIVEGKIAGVTVYVVGRHGKDHQVVVNVAWLRSDSGFVV